MLPGVCLAIFMMCVCLLLLILIPIAGAVFSEDLKKLMEKDAEERHEEPASSVFVALTVTWFFSAICAGSLSNESSSIFSNLSSISSPNHFCLVFSFVSRLQWLNGMFQVSCIHCTNR